MAPFVAALAPASIQYVDFGLLKPETVAANMAIYPNQPLDFDSFSLLLDDGFREIADDVFKRDTATLFYAAK